MYQEIILSFFSNVLFVMSLGVFYSLFSHSKITELWRKVLMGVAVAVVGIIVMSNAYEVSEGVIFDMRPVLMSVTGMFLGIIPAIIGGITLVTYRVIIGGPGTAPGVLWVIVSVSLGLLWRQYRLKNKKLESVKITSLELYVFSVGVGLIMIFILWLYRDTIGMDTIKTMSLPIIVIYPIGGLIAAQFLLVQRKNHFNTVRLAEQEKEYNDLFNKSNIAHIIFERESGHIQNANTSALKLYGYSLEEFTKLHLRDINVLPDEELIRLRDAALENTKNFIVTKNVTKDQKIIDVELYYGSILIQGKQMFSMTIIDISKRLEQEAKLHDVDEKLRSTLHSVAEGIVLTGAQGNIEIINEVAVGIIDMIQPPVNKNISDIFRIYSSKDKRSFKEIYESVIKNGEVFQSDESFTLIKNRNNEEIFVDFSLSPILPGDYTNRGAILVIRDVTIENERRQKINFISQHDFLTGLYNRYHFEGELERLDTKRQLPISLLIGDVNGLKLVNDTFGHLEGDRLISEIGDILKRATRSEDITARWGGDEFTILLPQTTPKDAMKVVERIRDLCSKSRYKTITPSIAIGMATKISEDQDIFSVLEQAETAMYELKKEQGKEMRQELIDNLEAQLNDLNLSISKHSKNVSVLMNEFGTYLKMKEEEISNLTNLGKYHDIGMIALDEPLFKSDTSDNFSIIDFTNKHPEVGFRIASSIPELNYLANWIYTHHERYNGSGFPDRLRGEEIPYFARILSIVNDYEIFTNDENAAGDLSQEKVIEMLEEKKGIFYDPDILDKFIKMIKEKS